jgi:hypothetical protein
MNQSIRKEGLRWDVSSFTLTNEGPRVSN